MAEATNAELGLQAAGASLHADYPPCISYLTFAASFVDPRPCHDTESEILGTVSTDIHATSGDGLVLVCFCDSRNHVPTVGSRGGELMREWSARRQSRERDSAGAWSASASIVGRHCLNHRLPRRASPQPPAARASSASAVDRLVHLRLQSRLPERARGREKESDRGGGEREGYDRL
uniref:Uncharacterized protein n=1 Tax=Oryza sativa subsp. japonica TaxID=39947 RepID=Q2QXG9_ORYSJ|nr:hypothetical protein LOC_Os12g06090 [Oryza sativa Japonica Group]